MNKRLRGKHKYNAGEKVTFSIKDAKRKSGIIRIVDAFGTLEQVEEPSYDIFDEEEKCLYKHIRESEVTGKER